jgi:hypothetical protein
MTAEAGEEVCLSELDPTCPEYAQMLAVALPDVQAEFTLRRRHAAQFPAASRLGRRRLGRSGTA